MRVGVEGLLGPRELLEMQQLSGKLVTSRYFTYVCESDSQKEGSGQDGFRCSNQPANTGLITAFPSIPE